MRVWFVAAIIVIALIIAFSTQQQKEATIKVGGLFALTSFGSQFGEGERDAVILAIDAVNKEGGINGKKIELITEDTQTDLTKTSSAIRKLFLVDSVDVIIGPTWFFQIAVPSSIEYKKLIISPSAGGGNEENLHSPYFFNTWPRNRFEVVPVVREMKTRGYQKVTVVYSINDWSQNMKGIFLEEAEKINLTIVDSYGTQIDEKDFRTLILKIKEADVDAAYIPFAFPTTEGEFAQQAKLLNLNATLFSTSNTENALLLENFGEFVEGMVYTWPAEGPENDAFVQKFGAKYGKKPSSPSAANAYDAARLIIEAYKNGAKNSDEVIEFLKGVKDFKGASNTVSFDEFGGVREKLYILKTIQNGQFIKLE